MPYWRLFYHLNWATKQREYLISPDIELRLYGFLRKEAEKMFAPLAYVNGMPDHIHMLVRVRPALAPADLVKQLKGSSSHFITHQLARGFEWQQGYGVLSVSESDVPRIIEYIKNQKQHHADNTLWQALEESGQDE